MHQNHHSQGYPSLRTARGLEGMAVAELITAEKDGVV